MRKIKNILPMGVTFVLFIGLSLACASVHKVEPEQKSDITLAEINALVKNQEVSLLSNNSLTSDQLMQVIKLCISTQELSNVTLEEENAKKAQSAFDRALEFMQTQDYKSAVSQFKSSLKLDGKNPDVWYNYGTCLLEQGTYETAVGAFEKAAEFYENSKLYDNPQNLRLDALVGVGEAYLWQNKVEQAKSQFQNVLDSSPENKNLVLNIVATYIRCSQLESAVSFLKYNFNKDSVQKFLNEHQMFMEMIK